MLSAGLSAILSAAQRRRRVESKGVVEARGGFLKSPLKGEKNPKFRLNFMEEGKSNLLPGITRNVQCQALHTRFDFTQLRCVALTVTWFELRCVALTVTY